MFLGLSRASLYLFVPFSSLSLLFLFSPFSSCVCHILTGLRQAGHERYRQDMLAKGPEWCKKLAAMPDFYLELQWDFSVLGGWVPLVSGYMYKSLQPRTRTCTRL